MRKRLLQFTGYIESTVLVVFAVSATLIMFGNSTSRYLLRTTFAWADESIRLIFVWSMFFAITTAFIRNQHISFLALAHLNAKLRFLSGLLYELTLLVVGAIVAYYGHRYMGLTGAVRLPGTELPTAMLLLPGVLSGTIWALLGAFRICLRFVRLAKAAGKPDSVATDGGES